jgi:hypothetical protein
MRTFNRENEVKRSMSKVFGRSAQAAVEMHVLIARYRGAGLTSIAHDF